MISALITAVMASVAAAVSGTTHEVTTRTPPHGAPPRLVWRPQADAFGPARKATAPVPRSLATVRMTFAVEIWGESVAQVETLREAVLRGLHATAPGSWQALGGVWAEPGMVDAGELYTLTCAVSGQQHDATPATETLTDAALTPPASSDAGELDSGDTT